MAISRIVSASADDAHEAQFGADFTSVAANITSNSNTGTLGRYNGGFRFTNITIPQGETILSAYITVQPINTNTDDANIVIRAEDVDDAVDFATNADVTSRVRTTAGVSWVQDGLGAGDVTSPDIAAVIQEIVDRPGWASGNDIVILFIGNSDVNKVFQVQSYDASTTLCARLSINSPEQPQGGSKGKKPPIVKPPKGGGGGGGGKNNPNFRHRIWILDQ